MGHQNHKVLCRLFLFTILPLVSVTHDLIWFSGRIPWQPYEHHNIWDLAAKGLVYTLVYMLLIPSPISITHLLAYASVISLYSKIFSLASNALHHEDFSVVYLQHGLVTYSLFQKICAFKFIEWLCCLELG